MTALPSALLSKRLYRTLLTALGVAAAALAGYFFISNRPLSVPVAQVEERVAIRVFGLGTVEARVLSKIGFEVGATLVALEADHGDRVKKGDILARLTSVEQEAKVAKAKASLTSAEVNIKKAEANLQKATAVLAQKQETNQRKQALVGRNISASIVGWLSMP